MLVFTFDRYCNFQILSSPQFFLEVLACRSNPSIKGQLPPNAFDQAMRKVQGTPPDSFVHSSLTRKSFANGLGITKSLLRSNRSFSVHPDGCVGRRWLLMAPNPRSTTSCPGTSKRVCRPHGMAVQRCPARLEINCARSYDLGWFANPLGAVHVSSDGCQLTNSRIVAVRRAIRNWTRSASPAIPHRGAVVAAEKLAAGLESVPDDAYSAHGALGSAWIRTLQTVKSVRLCVFDYLEGLA